MRRYLGVLGLVILLSACTGDPQSRQALNSGKQALAAGQSSDAIRDADAVISSGDTPALAEAYFLRGYAIEMRQKPDNAAAAHDFAMARDSYTRGLTFSPRPEIAARLHAQLGNVCYYQEDYAAAVPEFMTAFNSLDSSQPRDEVLYRMGISEQRLGRFDDADRTFQQVQQQFPGSAYAAPAAAHFGIRGFYVQLGAYTQQKDVNSACNAVRRSGSAPLIRVDKIITVVRTANVPSYSQAQQLRAQIAVQYPDARVMP